MVYQRVKAASVQVGGETAAAIGPGALLLVGVRVGDTAAEAVRLADKAARLRVFEDQGRFSRSLLDVGGAALAVPNFTLLASCRHGRRPELLAAAKPDEARPLFEAFVAALRAAGVREVAAGVFGAHMEVSLTNDGPVTLLLDTADGR